MAKKKFTGLKQYVFRFENIQTTKTIDTSRCVAIGFLNTGTNAATLNNLFPIPFQNPNNSYNMVWFPLLDNERDATRYQVFFLRGGNLKRVLVCYKEPLG